MADFFKTDVRAALLKWAEVQMPTEAFKAVFRNPATALPATSGFHKRATDAKASPPASAPQLENTWVFGPQEREMIVKHPWFFELCQRLSFTYPNGLSFKDFGFKKKDELEVFVQKHLRAWIEQGRFEYKNQALRILFPHIHLPKTAAWFEIRTLNLSRVLERLSLTVTPETLAGSQAYREIITRTLTAEQIKYWTQRMQEVEAEFKNMPYTKETSTGATDTAIYTWMSVFGERKLKLN